MLWWAAISSSLEHSHQECQKAKNVINNNQHTKNTLHQRSQMLKFLLPFYSKLPSLATHCSWVSKLNINFLIPTCALSLIFSFSHAFFFLSFSLLVLPQPRLFSSLYDWTQKPTLETHLLFVLISKLKLPGSSWVGVLGHHSWVGLVCVLGWVWD